MTAFFTMLVQIFSSITKYFVAFEKTANATVHLATWAEESAGAFADESRIKRQAQLNAMLAEANLTAAQLTEIRKP